MLIDLHSHSAGISLCCLIPYNEVIDTAIANGIDGLVLTNHYTPGFIKDGDPAAFSKRYVEEYRMAKEYADSIGFCLFFGVEVTLKKHNDAHVLLIGIDEDFVLAHPCMYDYTLEELYKLVKQEDGVLIQAHPFRRGGTLLDTAFLDGIELSCHPLYEGTRIDVIPDIARKEGITVTCGGDYHADTPYRPRCGAYLDEGITDGKALARYLCSAKEIPLCVHEVRTDAPYDYTFKRD